MGTCERCKIGSAITGYRFCKECKKIILKELQAAGYLETRHLARGKYRTQESKEITQETKFGTNQG
jgi:hypothetical protein